MVALGAFSKKVSFEARNMGALRPPELACSVSILRNQGEPSKRKTTGRMFGLAATLHLVFWNHKPFMIFIKS